MKRKFVLAAMLIVALFVFAMPTLAQSDSTTPGGLPNIDVSALLALLQEFGSRLTLVIAPFLTSGFGAFVVQFIMRMYPDADVARISLIVGLALFVITLIAVIMGFKPQLDAFVNLVTLILPALFSMTAQVVQQHKALAVQTQAAAKAQAAAAPPIPLSQRVK